jgi:LysR family cys regulon transcriptional activator
MNFQQLRIIRETVRCDLNLTEVGHALATSQSGVSKHIKELEAELGVELFVRRGKRLTDITVPGRRILPFVERMLTDAGNIRRVADELRKEDDGALAIATTHTQALYVLPAIIAAFRKNYPAVRLVLHQAGPTEIARMLDDGRADIGIATEALSVDENLAAFPFIRWRHAVIVRPDHRWASMGKVSLGELAREPLITYQHGYTGRSAIDSVFKAAGLAPDIVLEAIDSDVIRAYVRLGMGVGIVSDLAIHSDSDTGLSVVQDAEFFTESTSFLAVRRERFLRGFAIAFLQACAPE